MNAIPRIFFVLGLLIAGAASAAEPAAPAGPERMMNFHQVTPTLATAGAPVPADFAALKAAGYTLVVDLRTPEEGLEASRDAARALGLEWVNVPVTRTPERAQLDALSAVLDAHPQAKTLVHCASNKRASSMVMLDQVTRRGVPLAEARRHVDAVWTPTPAWQAFFDETLKPTPVDPKKEPAK